jgi:hypothetical protein
VVWSLFYFQWGDEIIIYKGYILFQKNVVGLKLKIVWNTGVEKYNGVMLAK